MKRNRGILGAALTALMVAGCATTSFTSVWKAPDVQTFSFKPGDKMIAMVMANGSALRRSAEANLADELDKRGFDGIPSYTLIQDSEVTDEGKVKRTIDASGAVGMVVLRPKGTEKEVSSYSTGYYGSPYYGGFYGGYYGYGWGGAWGGGTEIRTDTYVNIETVIYDLKQNKLLWAGQTRTMNPSDVEGFVSELATAVGKELQESGLVPAKK